ncbi:MAG: hypothetical protein PF541_07020 [Prolixibacteraceae bacterium]|jgi:hypothetical protein|nr:hypothetical protein [Prolixibacteraceae bacterium]
MRKYLLCVCITCFLFVVAKAQSKFIQVELLSYSPKLVVNQTGLPYYQTVDVGLLIKDKLRLKFSNGLLSSTKGEYDAPGVVGGNAFESFSGVTSSLGLLIRPLNAKRLNLDVGCGLKYMYIKGFQTFLQRSLVYVLNGEEAYLPFQYFNTYASSKLGVDVFLDLEYLISSDFSMGINLNFMNYKSSGQKDFAYISAGMNFTYRFKNKN